MKIVQNCVNEKVYSVLCNLKKNTGKVGIFFSHGLGDCVLFIPLFNELIRVFPDWDLYLCFNPVRNYSFLHSKSKIIKSPFGNYGNFFDVLFNLSYFEAPRNNNDILNFQKKFGIDSKISKNLVKPFVCNLLEIGLPNFKWEPLKLDIEEDLKYINRIGVHFFGRPSSGINRDIDLKVAELVWKELEWLGYKPFEIQMFSDDVPYFEAPDFIGTNTLRDIKADLRIMSKEISKCKYFLGIDSGVIYLAGSILGFDKCIGLEKERKFNKVLPINIDLIDIYSYKEMDTIRAIYNKEKENAKML
jgi:hypothetical protein